MAVECSEARRFEAVWDAAAENGSCDARGGMEYVRVRAEWHAAGCPADVLAFIVEAANRPAPPGIPG